MQSTSPLFWCVSSPSLFLLFPFLLPFLLSPLFLACFSSISSLSSSRSFLFHEQCFLILVGLRIAILVKSGFVEISMEKYISLIEISNIITQERYVMACSMLLCWTKFLRFFPIVHPKMASVESILFFLLLILFFFWPLFFFQCGFMQGVFLSILRLVCFCDIAFSLLSRAYSLPDHTHPY